MALCLLRTSTLQFMGFWVTSKLSSIKTTRRQRTHTAVFRGTGSSSPLSCARCCTDRASASIALVLPMVAPTRSKAVESVTLEPAGSCSRGSGWACSGSASSWECRITAQSRQARQEEAQQPSWGSAKAGTLTMLWHCRPQRSAWRARRGTRRDCAPDHCSLRRLAVLARRRRWPRTPGSARSF